MDNNLEKNQIEIGSAIRLPKSDKSITVYTTITDKIHIDILSEKTPDLPFKLLMSSLKNNDQLKKAKELVIITHKGKEIAKIVNGEFKITKLNFFLKLFFKSIF
ncbi:hypothetical protein OO013_10005 [Mangrovivirga sp. M17]|uniref:Uncharacterized protein n=1 Tax=Mangrovivirga halotolerans TaxID=2993936 RepID=A0ABT3RR02_9BACT|nr:hypothetical protein [Mangrovivirga halotolerans]MCX2744200.1 hypothetical protein [Mangrovivirga halotolerans]